MDSFVTMVLSEKDKVGYIVLWSQDGVFVVLQENMVGRKLQLVAMYRIQNYGKINESLVFAKA